MHNTHEHYILCSSKDTGKVKVCEQARWSDDSQTDDIQTDSPTVTYNIPRRFGPGGAKIRNSDEQYSAVTNV